VLIVSEITESALFEPKCSGEQIKDCDVGGGETCGTYGGKQQCILYKVLAMKVEGKWPSGRHRCRWENIIQKDLKEIGWEGVEWIDLAQGRDKWQAVMSTAMNLRVITYSLSDQSEQFQNVVVLSTGRAGQG
jgi:hypothetical protein